MAKAEGKLRAVPQAIYGDRRDMAYLPSGVRTPTQASRICW